MIAMSRSSLQHVAGMAAAWIVVVVCPPALVSLLHGGQGPMILRTILPILLAALAVALGRRMPLTVLSALELGWFGAAFVARERWVAYVFMLITDLAVAYIAATRSRRVGAVAGGMALTGQVISGLLLFQPPDTTVNAVLVVLGIGTAWMAGDTISERRGHAQQLAEQATAQAVTSERLRIARELHDMVAHSVGIIAIQAGVGSRVIETQPAEARKALSAIEATSRETLAGLRRMLGALRQTDPDSPAGSEAVPREPAPGLADLERLTKATMDAGVRVEVRWAGERRPLSPDIDLSAFRIVQEALTNVVRHAGTDHCMVTIEYGDDELVVEIVDDGAGHQAPGAGYGLIGMRERVNLLKGRLVAGPRPEGGFRVESRLPLPAGSR